MLNISNLESKHKLLFLIFTISILAIISTFILGSDIKTIYILTFSIIFTYITKAIWLPDGYGKNKVRLYSLFIALMVFTSSKNNVITNIINSIIVPKIPSDWYISEIIKNYPNISSIPILVFMIIVIYIVNRHMSPVNVMGEKQNDFDRDIPEPEFHERLKNAMDALADDMHSINKQTNWSGSFFTNLDAEVYIKTRSGRTKKVSNLLKALKRKSGRAFLVLGEPGSGKSVALRKLSVDLLKEVNAVNKIPLYINLKEWNNTNWSETSPPTEDELYEFVKDNVARRDRAISIFVDQYFDRLYEKRKLFFIFDSFDEIPQVMNVDDNSMLIDQLSAVLYKFIKDKNNQTAGIVASRKFRKPTNSFKASSEIGIRPFNEKQVITSIKKMSANSSDLINDIFSKRVDLYQTAKNPFMASMIAKHIEINNKLPRNQLEMFSVFIDDALTTSHRKLKELSLSKEDLILHSQNIAVKMFSDYGLEASVSKLKLDFPNINIDAVIDCLKFARIVRASSIDEGRVSFVHRRFCEYFVVIDILKNNSEIPFADIPRDSQWRDALVLYCEVASKKQASEIANKCWEIIKKDNGNGNLESIHCMRFLRDAFKGRHECLADFQAELEQFITTELEKNKPVYWIKLVVELSCLSKVEKIENNTIKSLKTEDTWICQTAIESCRNLPSISNKLEYELCSYINKESDYKFLKNFTSYFFTFGISEAFHKIKYFLIIRSIDQLLLLIVFIYSLIIYPLFTSVLFSFFLLISSTSYLFTYIYPIIENRTTDEKTKLNYFKKITNQFKTNLKNKHIEKKMNNIDVFDIIYHNLNLIKLTLLFTPFIIAYASFIFYVNNTHVNIDNTSLNNLSLIIKSPEKSDVIFLISLYIYLLFSMLKMNLIIKKPTSTKSIKNIILSILLISLIMFAVFPMFIHFITNQIPMLKYIMMAFYSSILIILIPFTIRFLSSYYKLNKKLKKININKLKTRSDIYYCIKSLENHSILLNKLIDRIEINIHQISGEWPDNSVLNLSSGKYASRLSQLDMRWRGIE
ncbi:NACHT domain-containing protein [Photobacterium andalusiense]|uniref:NACHT domain protein n=1 Tax=Photobacterium andalusiense TaxID=2204296 RepID=A0A1Y6M9K4_9GAMM|nr:NACHT domain-containing protein [Photobacterium andalusiense]SMY33236.1 NACHT domain protein [Photobacterium andalusiense]